MTTESCEDGKASSALSQTMKSLVPEWEVSPDGKKIWREFTFGDYSAATEFVVKIKDIANRLDHHPDQHILCGQVMVVKVETWTHTINGISHKDLTLAAEIDQL